MDDTRLPRFFIAGITEPKPRSSATEEASLIMRLLNSGAVDLIHLRKPEASAEYTLSLIENIDQDLHSRLVLHSHFHLINNFRPGGVHDKQPDSSVCLGLANQMEIPLSCSCHSLEDFCKTEIHKYSYCFLSPIFDSISKTGYLSRFSLDDPRLHTLASTHRIVALGGVTPDHFAKLYAAKFAGAALLGYLWSPKSGIDEKIKKIITARKNIIKP